MMNRNHIRIDLLRWIAADEGDTTTFNVFYNVRNIVWYICIVAMAIYLYWFFGKMIYEYNNDFEDMIMVVHFVILVFLIYKFGKGGLFVGTIITKITEFVCTAIGNFDPNDDNPYVVVSYTIWDSSEIVLDTSEDRIQYPTKVNRIFFIERILEIIWSIFIIYKCVYMDAIRGIPMGTGYFIMLLTYVFWMVFSYNGYYTKIKINDIFGL